MPNLCEGTLRIRGEAEAVAKTKHEIYGNCHPSIELVKEVHFLRRILQDITDDVLEHVLSELHVVREIRKAELGLDHPELGCVAGGVGDLGTEGRTEGIDIAEGKCIGLDVQLAADGQVDGLSEEIL